MSGVSVRCDAVGYAWTACSGDRVEVWHGLSTPAYACGRHAAGDSEAVFCGHRGRVSREVVAPRLGGDV